MTDDDQLNLPRWHNYVMEHGDNLLPFLRLHLADRERDVLFVLGKGFDPRMCQGLETLLSAGGRGRRDVLAVEFHEGPSSPSERHEPQVQANWLRVQTLLDGRGSLHARSITTWSVDGRRIASRSATNLFAGPAAFDGYSDVVIDISALPQSIYFPMIGKALYLLDGLSGAEVSHRTNLHVFVSENPVLDSHIRQDGVDDAADYLYPFEGGLGREATREIPRIWIPILGEGQEVQFERIHDLVMPDEICPVLPSPSLNPRRGDDLVLEYRDVLFDRLRIDPGNFIYASERNPFEVYKQIRRTILHYRSALLPLRGCKSVLSALSSKLMSVGALLVAYELKQKKADVGVAHVESQGHVMDPAFEVDTHTSSELFSLWISGECYEA